MNTNRVIFDTSVWSRFRRVVTGFLRSPVGGRGKAWLVALLLLLVGINGLNVLNSYVGRDFMTAIEHRDQPGFLRMAALYLAVFAISTAVAALLRYSEERLGLLWREWLTRRAVDLYLTSGTYYRMRELRELENPDQRISEDVRYFTITTLSFLIMVLNASFAILAFAGVLWSISPTLLVVGMAYAGLGSALTLMFGRPLILLNYQQLDREAGFRADLLHLRENAESIALLHSELQLRARLRYRIRDLVTNAQHIIAVNRNLTFFTSGYNYLIQIIPALIVAPLFIRGEVEFGVVPQSAMAFSHLLGAFSLFVTQFQSISSYAAVLARLSTLDRALEQRVPEPSGRIERVERPGPLAFEQLTLRSPRDGRILVRALDATTEPGARVLVACPNEGAKLALFRAVAGIWTTGEGRILLPPADEIQFLAERPYLPPGCLRDVLRAGRRRARVEDVEILAALDAVGLEGVAARAGGLDAERDWDSVLSFADQQLLAVARALLAAPEVAVLHQISSALGPEQVTRCLARLRDAKITYLALGDPDSGPDAYDAVIELAGNGTWRWTAPQAAAATG